MPSKKHPRDEELKDGNELPTKRTKRATYQGSYKENSGSGSDVEMDDSDSEEKKRRCDNA